MSKPVVGLPGQGKPVKIAGFAFRSPWWREPDRAYLPNPAAVSLCAQAMSNPFAEEQIPWWRRLVHGDRHTYAPRSAIVALGVLAGFVASALPTHHSLAWGLLAAALTAAPAGLLETWYKRRQRRAEEQLFVLPEAPTIATTIHGG
jgi:hypothetical protein